MIDPDQLGQAAAGFGILAGGLWGGWQARRSNQNAQDAKVQATKAAEHAYPISNGWGTQLRDDLSAVRRTVDRIAEAQLLAERRELARDRLLQDHLQDHVREAATT
jgi:hypothetical protein